MFDIFGIISLILIAVFVIIGLIKGFLSLFLGLAKGLAAVAIAAIFCNGLGMLLSKTKLASSISTNISSSIVKIDASFDTIITNENKEEFINSELSEKLSKIKLPEVVTKYISNLLSKKVDINEEGITCAQYIAKGITLFICIAICFILLLVISLIILTIIQKLAKKINLVPLVGFANRLCGAALGVALALVFISIASFVLSLLMSFSWDFAVTLKNSLKLETDEFTIGKFFYEHNVLKWMFNLIFK